MRFCGFAGFCRFSMGEEAAGGAGRPEIARESADCKIFWMKMIRTACFVKIWPSRAFLRVSRARFGGYPLFQAAITPCDHPEEGGPMGPNWALRYAAGMREAQFTLVCLARLALFCARCLEP